MQTIFRLLTLVLVGALPVLMHTGSVCASEEILDQAQTETDDWSWIEDDYMGQIFTTGTYGFLTRISVYLENDSTNPATTPIMVSIQTIAGGVPSGNAAAFGQISPGNIPTSEGWVDVNLNEYMLVAEGTQYAIILSTSTGRVKWYGYFSSWEDNYDRGNVVVSYDNGVNWLNKFTYDMAFKTYVIPDTLDQAQTDDSTWCMYFADTQPAGQTFTAGLHGALNRVSVKLRDYENNPASGPIIVSIQTTTEQGLPSGEEVGRGEIPLDKIPAYGSGGQWIDVGINPVSNSPVAMESGTEYAFLLIPSEGAACWYQSQSDVYDGGSLMTRLGVGWMTTHEPFDGAFETYILEPVLDQNVDQQDRYSLWMTVYGLENYLNNNDHSYAQVFTAGKNGFLSRVSINMWGATGPATVRILPVGIDGVPLYEGLPMYNVLAVGIIPFDETQTDRGAWRDAWLSPLYYVNKGQKYAIKVTPSDDYPGHILWNYAEFYSGGDLFYMNWDIWYPRSSWNLWTGTTKYWSMFRTYVLPFKQVMQSGWGIEPCANDVCPEVSGGFTPADFTGGVKGHFDFRERTDGTVKGVLNFTDQQPDGLVLRGCTTDSVACRLTVTSFFCTDQHAITVAGSYTPRSGPQTSFRLNLIGVRDGIGTFTLKSGEYNYTLTRRGIVDVTCPPIGASP
jgi:hypothetical protein